MEQDLVIFFINDILQKYTNLRDHLLKQTEILVSDEFINTSVVEVIYSPDCVVGPPLWHFLCVGSLTLVVLAQRRVQ